MAVLFLLAASACGGGGSSPAAPSPTPAATPTPTPLPLTAAEVLERARVAMGKLQTFRFHLSHRTGATLLPGGFAITEAKGVVESPDNLEVSANTVFGGAFIKIDAVVLGRDTYMTNPLTRHWNRIVPEDSPFAVFDPPAIIADILAQVTENSFEEPAGIVGGSYRLVGSVPATALRSLVGEVDATRTLRYRMSIEPVRFRMTSVRLIGPLTADEDQGVDRTIELSDFDAPVLIEPPI